jgi:hypothetical protein
VFLAKFKGAEQQQYPYPPGLAADLASEPFLSSFMDALQVRRQW